MSNDVPQFPGKGGVGGGANGGAKPTAARPGWEKAVCPVLTAGEIARHKDNLLVSPGAQPPPIKAQPCLGPSCMMFVEVPLADGTVRAGCAPVQTFAQMVGLNMMVSEFIVAAKAGAAAEAAAANPTPAADPAEAPAQPE